MASDTVPFFVPSKITEAPAIGNPFASLTEPRNEDVCAITLIVIKKQITKNPTLLRANLNLLTIGGIC